jgi:hypothetical protein
LVGARAGQGRETLSEVTNMADPNWLYSTTAQSGAAIVAIIGGFLSARLLGLQSEKASLQREIADHKARTRLLEDRARDLRLDEETMLVRGALVHVDHDRAFGDPSPTVDELLSTRDLLYRDRQVVEQERDEFATRVSAAEDFVRDHRSTIDFERMSFDDWLPTVQAEIEYLGETVDIDSVERAFYRLRKKVEEERRRAAPFGLGGLFDASALLSPLKFHRPGERDPLDLLREEVAKLEAELSMTREETRVLEERLAAFAYPPNLWFGFIALVYLAVGGVIIPLLALPRDSNPAALRITVLTLFVSGLAAVFAFLASQVLGITAGGQRRGDGTSTGLKLPK